MTVKGEDFWMDELEFQLGRPLTPTGRDCLRTWLRAFAANVKRQQDTPTSPDDVMDVYVPGRWKCLSCGFELSQATIFMGSGEIGCSRDQVMRMTGELCPNDGAAMRRVTWREEADANREYSFRLIDDIITATGAKSLPEAIETAKAAAQQQVAHQATARALVDACAARDTHADQVAALRAALEQERQTWRDELVKRFPDGVPDDIHLPGSDF